MGKPIKIGDRVRAISNGEHNHMPDYYPVPGTIGVVKDTCDGLVYVRWPAGSVGMGGTWSCPVWSVEAITDEN